MKRIAPLLLTPTLTLLAPAAAFAAGGGEANVVDSLVWPAINLLLLLGVLFYFGRKPIKAFFEERRDGIKVDLDGAAKLRDEAEARLNEWQRKLAAVEEELENIRATARERAERERESILAEAESVAERIRNDARAAIEQEVRRAREELREEAADLAVEIAAQRISGSVTDSDRDRLLSEFIERVEHAPAAHGPAHGSNGSRS